MTWHIFVRSLSELSPELSACEIDLLFQWTASMEFVVLTLDLVTLAAVSGIGKQESIAKRTMRVMVLHSHPHPVSALQTNSRVSVWTCSLTMFHLLLQRMLLSSCGIASIKMTMSYWDCLGIKLRWGTVVTSSLICQVRNLFFWQLSTAFALECYF